MIDACEYSIKFPLRAQLAEQPDGRWGWVIIRGKKVIARHGITCKTPAEADKNMRRTLFAIRHDDKPVQIVDYRNARLHTNQQAPRRRNRNGASASRQ